MGTSDSGFESRHSDKDIERYLKLGVFLLQKRGESIILSVSMAFIKKTENFICEHCGNEVVGDGYTNHCPECLWSKHVDIDPGDRSATCGGLMKPIEYLKKAGEDRIIHECVTCKYTKNNRLSPQDSYDTLAKILKENSLEN